MSDANCSDIALIVVIVAVFVAVDVPVVNDYVTVDVDVVCCCF